MRAAIDVDDDLALARKEFQQSGAHRLHHLTHGPRVVMRRHADNDVHFADVNQLANEIVGKYAYFGQISS